MVICLASVSDPNSRLLPAEEREAERALARKVGRGAVRCVLGPTARSWHIRICKDELGKPFVIARWKKTTSREIPLSLSHAFPYALAVAAPTQAFRVGADVEQVRVFSDEVSAAFLTDQEASLLASCSEIERSVELTLCWSLKEAVLKALGVGLRMHPRNIDVSRALSSSGTFRALIGICGKDYEVLLWTKNVIHNRFVATAVALTADKYDIMALQVHRSMASLYDS